jgi:hypothetical protein
LPFFILSTEDVPPELLALLGPSSQAAQGRPYDVAKYLFTIAGGATSSSATWGLFKVEPPSLEVIPVLAQAVREGLDGKEALWSKLEALLVKAHAVAQEVDRLTDLVAQCPANPSGETEAPRVPESR